VAETIAAVIVGIAALILNAILAGRKEKEQSHETKRNELRQALADDDPAAVHGALADQHDRVREALRGRAGGRAGDHQ
jgi:FtsZ-interacting cell division protein ZipA